MIMKIKFSTGKEIELSSEEYEELRISIKQNLYGANKCPDCEYAPKIYNGTYPDSSRTKPTVSTTTGDWMRLKNVTPC
jgi:hypothetical protein